MVGKPKDFPGDTLDQHGLFLLFDALQLNPVAEGAVSLVTFSQILYKPAVNQLSRGGVRVIGNNLNARQEEQNLAVGPKVQITVQKPRLKKDSGGKHLLLRLIGNEAVRNRNERLIDCEKHLVLKPPSGECVLSLLMIRETLIQHQKLFIQMLTVLRRNVGGKNLIPACA